MRNWFLSSCNDFMRIDSLRAVTFRDKYGVQMIMRFNEIHKFSDDTLQQIDEALDYRVKENQVYRNESSFGTYEFFGQEKDVERSQEYACLPFMKRFKTKRIFCNLESFVGGRAVFILINGEPWFLQPYSTKVNKDTFVRLSLTYTCKNPDDSRCCFRNSDACYHDPEMCEYVGPKVTTSHGGNTTTKMIWRFTVADDLKECS
ncbi:hypothetical protein Tco_0976808 [Tanacetum coccineum]|uniref:Uncharacterized protein n=1 Tax=Tanacetum coccineum TaxID=301880 RepID=A0ABQ5EIC4_9ASTR